MVSIEVKSGFVCRIGKVDNISITLDTDIIEKRKKLPIENYLLVDKLYHIFHIFIHPIGIRDRIIIEVKDEKEDPILVFKNYMKNQYPDCIIK